MLNAGVIQESVSDWASSPVLIRKRDGSVRWCIDYRALNDVTVKDTFPLPLIEDCLYTLAGNTWFSKLDANSAYWQVLVRPEDRKKTAFDRFRHHGLKLKPRKCILFQSEVEFLGRVVSSNQLKMASKDIKAVTDWPIPTSSKEMERFLGLANYHRTFIKNFAELAQPLYNLSGKNPFKWGKDEQAAFDSLKTALTNPPVLGRTTKQSG